MRYLDCWFVVLLLSPIAQAEKGPHQQKWQQIQTPTEPQIQTQEVYRLLERIQKGLSSHFLISVDPQAGQTVRLDNTRIFIEVTASTGVLAVWGIHHYLKYNCGWHLSWDTYRVSDCPWESPVSFNLTANDRFRYYQNVCTPGYSFTFWQWPQWEAHIDWMALNGINLPLAFTAQEYIWIQVYKQVSKNSILYRGQKANSNNIFKNRSTLIVTKGS